MNNLVKLLISFIEGIIQMEKVTIKCLQRFKRNKYTVLLMNKYLLYVLIAILLSCKSKPVEIANNLVTIPNSLTVTEKIYGLSKFWQEVNYNFVYLDRLTFNLDSTYQTFIPKVINAKNDYEYYRELEKFCALLNDGHTNIICPSYFSQLTTETDFGKYRVELGNFQNKAIVVNTSESAKKEIPLGSEIIEVNFQPTADYLKSHILPYISTSTDYVRYDLGVKQLLKGIMGELVSIKIKTLQNEIRNIFLERKNSSEGWSRKSKPVLPNFSWKDNGIFYMNLRSFGDTSIFKYIRVHISDLRKAKALIIDLRENGGGSSGVGAGIAKLFSKSKVLRGSAQFTRKNIAFYNVFPKHNIEDTINNVQVAFEYKSYHNNRWQNLGNFDCRNYTPPDLIMTYPIALLIGHKTASAAEDFLVLLDKENHITKIGSNTYGSTGAPLYFSLPGGGGARICTKKDTYPDGREFVGCGIKPDIYVEETINDMLTQNDPVLNKALQFLGTKTSIN
jgi:C-terminal processing protease CtpA/Prc